MSQVPPSLAVERALRAAAREGNRLLAASVVRIRVSDARARDLLETALRRMGARLHGAAGASSTSPADFEFVDRLANDTEAAVATAAEQLGSTDVLPTLRVALDGAVASSRGSSASARIARAMRGMPATRAFAQRIGGRGARRPLRIAISLVLEPKTAAFAMLLADAGCEVAVFSSGSETETEVADALESDARISLFAPTTSSQVAADSTAADRRDAEHAAGVLEWGPEYLIDDGAHLIRLAHTERPAALDRLRGAAEETTSGVRPLREMEAAGALRVPVIAVNDARTKTDFDNRIGTGQSCVFAILDLLDREDGGHPRDDAQHPPGQPQPQLPSHSGATGTRWVVIGYGAVGQGVARFAAALGAHVSLVEADPVRALSALHDGYEVHPLAAVLPDADVVVSATGAWHTLTERDFLALRPGCAVAVAGGVDEELALEELAANGWKRIPHCPGVAEWQPPGGAAGPLVLADGAGVNYTAGEGNPIEVMDLSFATQLAAVERLTTADLAPGVHLVSAEAERLVAAAALSPRLGSRSAELLTRDEAQDTPDWTQHRYRLESCR